MSRPVHPLLKLAIEAGPLIVFFLVNARAGIFHATAAFMAAIVVSLILAYNLERRMPVMPLVTAGFVLVFGTLTLVLQDELFIKLKPTIVNTLFAAILAGGMLFGRPLLKPLFGAVLPLDNTGWSRLTWRWVWFFLLLALLNEIVWRNFSTDAWVNFKVFGIMPLTIAFSLAQLPLLQRHGLRAPEDQDQ
ncbi:MAG: septation protein A [Alphaproteobacteria bacterium]|nr:septation protein A [Alphaproteobacteria bacterium]